MPHARLVHPSRPTLEWRQGQTDEDTQDVTTDITPELGVPERPPLVHIKTRERQRAITGRITGNRRAENDPDTDDWEQALANYLDLLESHVDEFQGTRENGYTFEDDIRDESFPVVLESLSWELTQGAPTDITFDAVVRVGRPTMSARSLDRRNPSVQTNMDVAATVGGEDLPGLRQMQVDRSIGVETNSIVQGGADSTTITAQNNDVVPQSGPRQQITFRGTHTGDDATRAAADAALADLQGNYGLTFQTRFPGYALTGIVSNYTSNLKSQFGENSHQYALEFIEGERA